MDRTMSKVWWTEHRKKLKSIKNRPAYIVSLNKLRVRPHVFMTQCVVCHSRIYDRYDKPDGWRKQNIDARISEGRNFVCHDCCVDYPDVAIYALEKILKMKP